MRPDHAGSAGLAGLDPRTASPSFRRRRAVTPRTARRSAKMGDAPCTRRVTAPPSVDADRLWEREDGQQAIVSLPDSAGRARLGCSSRRWGGRTDAAAGWPPCRCLGRTRCSRPRWWRPCPTCRGRPGCWMMCTVRSPRCGRRRSGLNWPGGRCGPSGLRDPLARRGRARRDRVDGGGTGIPRPHRLGPALLWARVGRAALASHLGGHSFAADNAIAQAGAFGLPGPGSLPRHLGAAQACARSPVAGGGRHPSGDPNGRPGRGRPWPGCSAWPWRRWRAWICRLSTDAAPCPAVFCRAGPVGCPGQAGPGQGGGRPEVWRGRAPRASRRSGATGSPWTEPAVPPRGTASPGCPPGATSGSVRTRWRRTSAARARSWDRAPGRNATHGPVTRAGRVRRERGAAEPGASPCSDSQRPTKAKDPGGGPDGWPSSPAPMCTAWG